MKNENIILLVAVASAVFLWLNRAAVKAAMTGAQVIPNAAGVNDPGYGWQYFTGGTAIDPQGSYYFNGEKVYDGVTVGNSYLGL